MSKKERLRVQRLFFDGQELRTKALIQGGQNEERSFFLARKHADEIASDAGSEIPDNAVFVRALLINNFSWGWWILWNPDGKDILQTVRAELSKKRYSVIKIKSEIKEDE